MVEDGVLHGFVDGMGRLMVGIRRRGTVKVVGGPFRSDEQAVSWIEYARDCGWWEDPSCGWWVNEWFFGKPAERFQAPRDLRGARARRAAAAASGRGDGRLGPSERGAPDGME